MTEERPEHRQIVEVLHEGRWVRARYEEYEDLDDGYRGDWFISEEDETWGDQLTNTWQDAEWRPITEAAPV